jgi:hypothetical protein
LDKEAEGYSGDCSMGRHQCDPHEGLVGAPPMWNQLRKQRNGLVCHLGKGSP